MCHNRFSGITQIKSTTQLTVEDCRKTSLVINKGIINIIANKAVMGLKLIKYIFVDREK